MLILTIKAGEIVRIGQDIQAIALNVSSNQIRLGIEAPQTISILKKELHKRKKINTHKQINAPPKQMAFNLKKYAPIDWNKKGKR